MPGILASIPGLNSGLVSGMSPRNEMLLLSRKIVNTSLLSVCGDVASSLFQACFLGYETSMRVLNWILPNW